MPSPGTGASEASEPMLTMCPRPRASMRRAAARVPSTVPFTLTARCISMSRGSMSCTQAGFR
jgi:hypothetical protein